MEDIRALKRCADALAGGRPMPMALREARVWGERERAFERLLPGLDEPGLTRLLHAAQICDGIIKGLRHPEWPADLRDALRRLVLLMLDRVHAAQGPARSVNKRLALRA
jgi:DNA polymerase-3 subunit delta